MSFLFPIFCPQNEEGPPRPPPPPLPVLMGSPPPKGSRNFCINMQPPPHEKTSRLFSPQCVLLLVKMWMFCSVREATFVSMFCVLWTFVVKSLTSVSWCVSLSVLNAGLFLNWEFASNPNKRTWEWICHSFPVWTLLAKEHPRRNPNNTQLNIHGFDWHLELIAHSVFYQEWRIWNGVVCHRKTMHVVWFSLNHWIF